MKDQIIKRYKSLGEIFEAHKDLRECQQFFEIIYDDTEQEFCEPDPYNCNHYMDENII